MFTHIFLLFVSTIFLVIAYFIKYKKRYHLIAGYTDHHKNDKEKVKFKANLIADSAFFFALLLIVFSILYFYVDWFKSTIEGLDGMFIILVSLLFTVVFYVMLYFLKISRLKRNKYPISF